MIDVIRIVVLLAVFGAGGEGKAGALLYRDLVKAQERARVELIARVAPAVACLFEAGEHRGGGSGVIIDGEGYGLTNYHVVANMLEERVGEAGLNNHQLYDFDVLGIDPTGDVAMIRLKSREPLPFATLGDSDALRVGDRTLAMGNPFLLAEDYTPTVTLGIISGLHRYQWGEGRALRYTECIQVDTSINPGNSGGPLFNLAGELVGINGRVSIGERGRVNVGVGYAISINQIKRFIPGLRAGLATAHAAAGFTVDDREGRVIVNQLQEESEAQARGLRLGDEIVRFGGRDIATANQLVSVLGTFPGGWPVEVVYRREGQTRQERIRLENLPLPSEKEADGRSAGGAADYAAHPAAKAANRRGVRRAIKLLRQSAGGEEVLSSVGVVEFIGERGYSDRPAEAREKLRATERTPKAGASAPSAPSAEAIEREIRWRLWSAESAEAARAYRVVGGDEADGRIAVVLEGGSVSGIRHRLWFDDEQGELLAMEFSDPASGRSVRYEYGDVKLSGSLRWPHRMRMFLDGVPVFEDVFDRVVASAQGP